MVVVQNVYTISAQEINCGFINTIQTKRQSSVWVFPMESAPVKFKRARSVGKQMVASFFSKKGHIVSVPFVEQKTVTANWYVDVCIPKVLDALQSGRRKTGLREFSGIMTMQRHILPAKQSPSSQRMGLPYSYIRLLHLT